MKSDQSNQTKPSSKDSEIEDLVEAFTNNLPVQATEIGWEQIGEEQQDFIKSIDQYTQSKLKAFAGEIEKAIGIPTQTFHTESGLSDATDTQINIAVDDMITWIKNGGSIDKKEREWFKSRTVEQVPKDLQAKGANLLRKEVLESLKAIKEKAGIE